MIIGNKDDQDICGISRKEFPNLLKVTPYLSFIDKQEVL